MRLACSTLPFRKKPLSEALEKMASLGVRRIELCVDPHHSDPSQWDKPQQDILRLIRNLGISVNSIHVPMPRAALGPSRKTLRQISTDITKKTIELAEFLDAQFVVQHVGLDLFPADMAQPFTRLNTIPDLIELTNHCTASGIQLALENVPTLDDRMLGSSAEELRDLLYLLPPETVGLCLDVTHCIAGGFDPLEALEIIDFRRLISIHASDSFKNQRIDQHLAIGAGDFPWQTFFEKLKFLQFRGSLVLELADNGQDGNSLRDSLRYLKKFKLDT